MGHKRPLEGLLAEKDEKIAGLENRIQGYVGRLSLLQSRLLATLDTLDVMQSHQAQELRDFIRNQAIMRERLDEYSKVVKAAELERDDMRDAVLKLVEKVEASNDYSCWPHSQIRLSNLADPVAVTQGKSGKTVDEEELISYASAIIEQLRRERDIERKAHTQTRESAEARILALEAKVSRREAELEACVANAEHGEAVREDITPRATATARAVEFGDGDVIPSDQIISILDNTVARNKVLEREISALYRRLENARAASSESSSDVPLRKSNAKPMPKTQVSSHLDWFASSTTDIVSPLILSLGDQNTPTKACHEKSLPDFDHDILRDLEDQIKLLSKKIDSFADERNALLQTISVNRPFELEKLSHENLETRLRILENECLGLKASENALRDELEATRAHANARENELLDAMNYLRLALSSSPRPLHSTPQTHQTENAPDLLDPNDDGEISMELATPLVPLTSIPGSPPGLTPSGPSVPTILAEMPHEEDQHSPFLDPPFIPLPASPRGVDEQLDADDTDTESDHANSPTLSHIVIPMLGTEGSMNFYRATSSFVAELRQVENEIAGAQVQLNVGETALDRIEDLVHDLHPP